MLVLTMFLCGCVSEEDQGETQGGFGDIQLMITDKPADFEILHANVTISSVEVHMADANQTGVDEQDSSDDEEDDADGFVVSANGDYEGIAGVDIQFLGSTSGGEQPYNWSWDFGDGNSSNLQNPLHNYSSDGVYTVNLTVTDNESLIESDTALVVIGEEQEEESDAGWYTIVDEPVSFDLILLRNVSEVLGESSLSAGRYTQIRLVVQSAEITINQSGNISVHELTIPSGTVKLVKSFWILENETTVLTLDFDVEKSVHQTGNEKFMLKPTIKILAD